MSYTARRRVAVAVAVTVAIGMTLGAGTAPAATAPVRLILADHPLVGRIWSVRERRYVAPSDVERAAREARYLLLGERHGNPDHHRLQGRLIEAAAAAGRPVAVVAEQLDFPQQTAIDACRRDCADFGAELGARVSWDTSGWPPYATYRPVFDAAARAGVPVLAGNAGAKRVRELGRGAEPTSDEAAWVARAKAPLATVGRERLVRDLAEGHCGHLPAQYAESLVLSQRLRDASLAATLERAAPDGTAVLVAGNGHARRDYGVPTLLPAAPTAPTIIVAFVEVAPTERSPPAYAPDGAYDYLWFTARVDEPDPCEQFRDRLKKMAPAGGPAAATAAAPR